MTTTAAARRSDALRRSAAASLGCSRRARLLVAALAIEPGSFYVGFATRIMIFALAATSLNLILGYGGMVSFGHAAFFGAGAYTVGILMPQGVAARGSPGRWRCCVAALLRAGRSARSALRTRGVYFIMITLAFAQMMYYLVRLAEGVRRRRRARPARRAPRSASGSTWRTTSTFYYVVLAILLSRRCYVLHRLRQRALRPRDRRRSARTRRAWRRSAFRSTATSWSCFVIAGAVAGLAGALLANQNSFVEPEPAALDAVRAR